MDRCCNTPLDLFYKTLDRISCNILFNNLCMMIIWSRLSRYLAHTSLLMSQFWDSSEPQDSPCTQASQIVCIVPLGTQQLSCCYQGSAAPP